MTNATVEDHARQVETFCREHLANCFIPQRVIDEVAPRWKELRHEWFGDEECTVWRLAIPLVEFAETKMSAIETMEARISRSNDRQLLEAIYRKLYG